MDSLGSLEYNSPDDVPPEVMAYDSKLSQLGVGKAGKLGSLVLRLERDSENGKTMVKEQYSQVPLFTQRALYLEETLPSMAYMYIISPSGGILQGDRYRMDITLKNNAFAHITTQGATRVYRMEKNYATQMVNITVDDGCYFEYIPDQIIPYRNSRFYQRVSLNVHDNATLVYSEIMVPGRVASGEYFEYDICYMKSIARNQNGARRFTDVAILQPKVSSLKTFGLIGDYNCLGNVYVVAKKEYISRLNEEINESIKGFDYLYGGSTVLPNDSGVGIRILGKNATDIRNAIFEIVRITRKIILNAQFSGIRKG